MIIFVIVNHEVLERRLFSRGLSLKYNPNPNWNVESYLEVSMISPSPKFTQMMIGGHFFGRAFTEFLSLEWMVDLIAYRVRLVNEQRSQ